MAAPKTQFQFRRATRAAVKLKVGIDGPSGSGKTYGALALAAGITNGGKIAVIDSENESASFYADAFVFDTLSFPDAQAETLIEIIDAAVAAGYDALIIDSLSHVWLKILTNKDQYQLENPKANNWAAWGLPAFGPAWEKVMKHILDAPIHVIATMRSKQAYEQQEKEGKKQVVKLGLQPQVRDGAEYEFGLVFSVNETHRAEATKDRTRMFKQGETMDLASPKLHERLVTWMNSETPAAVEDVSRMIDLMKHPAISDLARKTITNALKDGTPSANKVQRWTEQLDERITAASAQEPTKAAS